VPDSDHGPLDPGGQSGRADRRLDHRQEVEHARPVAAPHSAPDFAELMPFSRTIGIRFGPSDARCMRATLGWSDGLCTAGGVLHGGALMALADSAGAACAFLNLPADAAGTTTVESKTNRPVAVPSGDESLASAFTASGTLLYATASASGPFGSGAGASADWSSGYMAEWDATNRLWALPPGGTATPLAQAGNGALLAQPAASGDRLLVVHDDALWLTTLGSTSPAVWVAGPLYSSAAPSGYYGEVDWAGTFAWSAAGGSRGGSAELVAGGYYPPAFESP
jgi:1,4-dihydroxy-2-naphthoyl-CoA hydrolase